MGRTATDAGSRDAAVKQRRRIALLVGKRSSPVGLLQPKGTGEVPLRKNWLRALGWRRLESRRNADERIYPVGRVDHANVDAGIELKALGDLIREAGRQNGRRSA